MIVADQPQQRRAVDKVAIPCPQCGTLCLAGKTEPTRTFYYCLNPKCGNRGPSGNRQFVRKVERPTPESSPQAAAEFR